MSSGPLFTGHGESGERLALVDADVVLVHDFLGREDCREYLTRLSDNLAWREEEIVIWGKRMMQPRLIYWVGDPGAAYTYSRKRLSPNPWTDELRSLRERVEQRCAIQFNSVLLNLYRNNNDSMGWHSDDEPELGPEPIIASLSLGTSRTFLMKHKTNKMLRSTKIPLPSGSLLIMKGPTQRNWVHSIAKEATSCGSRINLTFRRIGPTNDPQR